MKWCTKIFVISLLFCTISSTVMADVINGGFETGDFTGWQTIGNAQIVDSSYGVAPLGGSYQAIISTIGGVSKDELLSFLGLYPGSQVWTLNILSGSAIKTYLPIEMTHFWLETKFLSNADVGISLPGPEGFPDSGFAMMGYLDARGRGAMGFWHTAGDRDWTLSSTPYKWETGYWGGISGSSAPFTATLFFAVVDLGPDFEGHGLLIDNVNIPAPEPGTIVLLMLGMMGLAGVRRMFIE